MIRSWKECALALGVDALAAASALLISNRSWQTITTTRPAPLPLLTTEVSGRTVDAAPTALALVALAGVVAVLATRGTARRGVGIVLALAGATLSWRAVSAAAAVSGARAQALARERHQAAAATASSPHVATHSAWPALTFACGALIATAGVLVTWRGGRWQAMSPRYETPGGQRADPARAPARLWSALDRGEDPTGDAPVTDPRV